MSTFGDELIRALNEALVHARGDGPSIVHATMTTQKRRKHCETQTGSDPERIQGKEASVPQRP